MEWNGMGWNGMGWDGMEWDGMEWNRIGWMEWNLKMEQLYQTVELSIHHPHIESC
jgi:hypothetical protein